MKPKRRTFVVVFGFKVKAEKRRRGAWVCVCMPECVTVVSTFIAFGTYEPYPKAPLQPWLNFPNWNSFLKEFDCPTPKCNRAKFRFFTGWSRFGLWFRLILKRFIYWGCEGEEWGVWRGRGPREINFTLTTPLHRAKSEVFSFFSGSFFPLNLDEIKALQQITVTVKYLFLALFFEAQYPSTYLPTSTDAWNGEKCLVVSYLRGDDNRTFTDAVAVTAPNSDLVFLKQSCITLCCGCFKRFSCFSNRPLHIHAPCPKWAA